MWEFSIDVGGTFTDCIGRSPENIISTCKVLSSALTKGAVDEVISQQHFSNQRQHSQASNFWVGYNIEFFDAQNDLIASSVVVQFDQTTGRFELEKPLDVPLQVGMNYELSSNEEAPVLAIRQLLGLTLHEEIPPLDIKLGTTQGTNALLTRAGAHTAFITTKGFADILLIANQDRPHLFELAIQKPKPLFEKVIEIDERLDAAGHVLAIPDPKTIRQQLQQLFDAGIESVAICLLHSYFNSNHEELVEQMARDVGFCEISRSSELSSLIKIVSRGETTVLNAYLNPVLRQYVSQLQTSLPCSRIRMMTSSGGLVDADMFRGHESLLSGPAGGVIGFSKTAQLAGFEKTIGFDMGGTSTDVSRFDGEYELEHETIKADVRVATPLLAIETVAAGGGSVCHFDGVKLAVGPQSAGANPGPACYGANGPLTITDANLFLGKIIPDQFPFPLDVTAVDTQLTQLCNEIEKSPLGKSYTPTELAEGFINIANANMVRAIRRISVAKGYQPSDYVLAVFGGAAAQHACSVARTLGIRKIFIHPYGGILSAYGVGLADVRRQKERSVLKKYDALLHQKIITIFNELAAEATAEVVQAGVTADHISLPHYSLDMRYVGVESTLHVVVSKESDWVAMYEELHEKSFGYRHSQRAIEITMARVHVIGEIPVLQEAEQKLQPNHPKPMSLTDITFHGQVEKAGVYSREQLQPGDVINGPAMISEANSTIIVDPQFRAEVLSRNELFITDLLSQQKPEVDHHQTNRVDPVALEIFNNQFASIAEQMGETLRRTSVSTNVKERLDFSCAIFSAQGDLVVNAPHVPVHLGAMSETVKSVLETFPDLSKGDVIVTNDPYTGGSHLPDVTVITPVHSSESDELIFLTASRSHHAEIGGIVPGSIPPFSTNLAEEGVMIRHFKLIDQGVSHEQELKQLLLSGPFPTRLVSDNLADITAQVAANQTGTMLLEKLVQQQTEDVVLAYMNFIQQAAAEKMKQTLQAMTDGEYHFSDHLDDGTKINVTITITQDHAVVDLSGTSDVVKTNLNANHAITTSAILYVFRCLINEEIPLNSGVLEPITIIIPSGLLNPPAQDQPEDCPAVVGGNVETSQRLVDVLLGALQKAAASQGTMNNLTFGDDSFGYYETICGGSGATLHAPGADAVQTHMTNTRLTDIEVIEHRYPVRIKEFSIRQQSGGQGNQQGGNGVIRTIEFLKPLHVSILSERRGPFPPYGLCGGEPGAFGKNMLQRAGGSPTKNLGGKVSIQLQAGDVLTILTPGGGGFGQLNDAPSSSINQ